MVRFAFRIGCYSQRKHFTKRKRDLQKDQLLELVILRTVTLVLGKIFYFILSWSGVEGQLVT